MLRGRSFKLMVNLLAGMGIPLLLFGVIACSTQSVAQINMEPVLASVPYSGSDSLRAIFTAEPNVPAEGDRREPWLGERAWLAGVQAGQEYIAQNPEPQNVQILTGMTTGEVWSFMQQPVSGALGVGCQYCHDINNFAADPYPQKASARLMLLLVRDLNSNYMANLTQWRGNYVQCATCHMGQAIDLPAVSVQNDFVLHNPPTDEFMTKWMIDTPAVHPQPAYVNTHSSTGTMLAMTNAMAEKWNRSVLPRPEVQAMAETGFPTESRQYFLRINETYFSVPGCYTCHRGYTIPSAAITESALQGMVDEGFTTLPPVLRGTAEIEK